MNTNAPIVAGTDSSAPALSVLRHSIQIAARSGAPMVALHVLDSGSLAHRAASGGLNHVWGKILERNEAAPMSYVEECRAKVDEQMMKALSPHAEPLATIKHRTVILESVLASAALTYHIHDRVTVYGFDEDLSRLGYAASDFTLVPSFFEPCWAGSNDRSALWCPVF